METEAKCGSHQPRLLKGNLLKGNFKTQPSTRQKSWAPSHCPLSHGRLSLAFPGLRRHLLPKIFTPTPRNPLIYRITPQVGVRLLSYLRCAGSDGQSSRGNRADAVIAQRRSTGSFGHYLAFQLMWFTRGKRNPTARRTNSRTDSSVSVNHRPKALISTSGSFPESLHTSVFPPANGIASKF